MRLTNISTLVRPSNRQIIFQKKQMKELLNAFIDGDLQTPPLCTAATKGSVGLVTMLLDKFGADKDFKGTDGDTPLITAADKSHLPVVEALLAGGAGVNIPGSGEETALGVAATGWYDGITRVLLDAGAKQDACDDTRGTPLMDAAYHGHLPACREYLVSRGCRRQHRRPHRIHGSSKGCSGRE